MSDEESSEEQPKAGGKKKLIIIAVLVVLLLGGAAAAFFMMGGEKKEDGGKDHKSDKPAEQAAPQAIYLALDPAFVVNFTGGGRRTRYLQAKIEVMSKKPEAIEALKLHMPAVRNALVLLLSGQSYDSLLSAEGKEQLRIQVLAAIQAIMKEQAGDPGIEAVYFTGFVMQ